jgi:hypothetical protein
MAELVYSLTYKRTGYEDKTETLTLENKSGLQTLEIIKGKT